MGSCGSNVRLGSYDSAWCTECNNTKFVIVSQILMKWGPFFYRHDNIWQILIIFCAASGGQSEKHRCRWNLPTSLGYCRWLMKLLSWKDLLSGDSIEGSVAKWLWWKEYTQEWIYQEIQHTAGGCHTTLLLFELHNQFRQWVPPSEIATSWMKLTSIWLMCANWRVIKQWKWWLHPLPAVGSVKVCQFRVTIAVNAAWIS